MTYGGFFLLNARSCACDFNDLPLSSQLFAGTSQPLFDVSTMVCPHSSGLNLRLSLQDGSSRCRAGCRRCCSSPTRSLIPLTSKISGIRRCSVVAGRATSSLIATDRITSTTRAAVTTLDP
ncbi:hypothetical protein L596_002933 [Steinernema carpocapsae]|uniref:Uncharacterized protein n=1 Tax=Steinernema carpocapsae TaxID=34508 RepID=A0A4V6I7U9_STECR|nr:hypothetical protein L596_002933 [Steinernema carpocapsae]